MTRGSDVRTVLVNGRIVVRDGEITTLDEEMVMEKARGFARIRSARWWRGSRHKTKKDGTKDPAVETAVGGAPGDGPPARWMRNGGSGGLR